MCVCVCARARDWNDWNDLERFEPHLLLATECFVTLFSALNVGFYRCGLAETFKFLRMYR